MENNFGHFDEPNIGEQHNDTIPVGFEKPITPFVPQPNFSSRGENFVHDAAVKQSYEQWIEHCKARALDLADADNAFAKADDTKETCARQYLTTVAQCVHAEGFDLQRLAKHVGRKVSKTDENNPYKFLMKCVDPNRPSKQVSKQSRVLIYALGQCDDDPSRLEGFFTTHSINDCLRMKPTKTDKGKREASSRKRLILNGLPEGVEGKVIAEIQIFEDKVEFLRLLENYTL